MTDADRELRVSLFLITVNRAYRVSQLLALMAKDSIFGASLQTNKAKSADLHRDGLRLKTKALITYERSMSGDHRGLINSIHNCGGDF